MFCFYCYGFLHKYKYYHAVSIYLQLFFHPTVFFKYLFMLIYRYLKIQKKYKEKIIIHIPTT